MDEVGEHQDVDEEDGGADPGEFVEEFVDFEGDEEGGHDDDHPLCPAFSEEEAGGFDEVEDGVKEGEGDEGVALARGEVAGAVHEAFGDFEG